MYFVPFFKAPEYGDGILHRRLRSINLLKAPFQGGVLLDVLTVFIQGGGPDTPEFPPCQGRLEEIRGVGGPFRGSGSHQGVEFVNKKDDLSLRALNFMDHRLEAIFKFPPEFGARHQGPQIQGEEPFSLEPVRDIACHDAPGQPFGNGGLPHPGLADKDRVVFGSAGEDLHDPADFLVPANHGIQLF